MKNNEYLKMSDKFGEGVEVYSGEDTNNWCVILHKETGEHLDDSHDGGFDEDTAEYVAHAINTHDKLVQKVVELQSKIDRLENIFECLRREIVGED